MTTTWSNKLNRYQDNKMKKAWGSKNRFKNLYLDLIDENAMDEAFDEQYQFVPPKNSSS